MTCNKSKILHLSIQIQNIKIYDTEVLLIFVKGLTRNLALLNGSQVLEYYRFSFSFLEQQ